MRQVRFPDRNDLPQQCITRRAFSSKRFFISPHIISSFSKCSIAEAISGYQPLWREGFASGHHCPFCDWVSQSTILHGLSFVNQKQFMAVWHTRSSSPQNWISFAPERQISALWREAITTGFTPWWNPIGWLTTLLITINWLVLTSYYRCKDPFSWVLQHLFFLPGSIWPSHLPLNVGWVFTFQFLFLSTFDGFSGSI